MSEIKVDHCEHMVLWLRNQTEELRRLIDGNNLWCNSCMGELLATLADRTEVPETFAERVQAIEAKIASLRADADKLEQMLVDLYKDPSK